MTSKSLEKICGCGQTPKSVFGKKPAQQSEKTDWLLWLCGRFRQAFRNRFEDTLKRLRLDAAENVLPENQISYGANCLRSSDLVHDFIQNVIARRQHAARQLQHAAIMQLLQHFVGRQDRFSVLLGSVLQTRLQLCTRVARRNF